MIFIKEEVEEGSISTSICKNIILTIINSVIFLLKGVWRILSSY